METIVEQIINNFDFAYMLAVNILTYIIIKTIDVFNGEKKVSIIIKRACLLLSIILVTSIYYYNGVNNIILINSAIATPVSWSWLFKPIFAKFNIDYKKTQND